MKIIKATQRKIKKDRKAGMLLGMLSWKYDMTIQTIINYLK